MDDLVRRVEADQSDVGRILKALFLPKQYGNNFRLASEGAGVISATGDLSQIFDVGADWAAATQVGQIASTDMMCFAFANIFRAFIYFVHNNAGANYKYDAHSNVNDVIWDTGLNVQQQTYFNDAVVDLAIPGYIAPHGNILYPGYDDKGNTYLWVDGSPLGGATNNMRVTFNLAPITTAGTVSWYYWNGKNASLWETKRFSTTAIYTMTAPPNGGAYMFVVVSNQGESTATTFGVSILGNRGCWSHHPIPEIETLSGNDPDFRFAYVNGIRVNACAFKAQNNSQEIAKNGNEISVTVAAGIPWSYIAAGSSGLSNLQNYRERSNAKGYYGVLLPDTDEDISDFFDDITPWYLAGADPVDNPVQTSFPLAERRPYKALGITAPGVDGRDFTFDVTHCIEYLTNWPIQSRDNPRTSEESLTAAIVIASTMETDYENPSHWPDIMASIGKYGARIVGLQIESPVLDAISKYHPALTIARIIGKNFVLPLEKKGFEALEKYANSKRSRR